MNNDSPPPEGAARRGSSRKQRKSSEQSAAKTKATSTSNGALPSAESLAQLSKSSQDKLAQAECERIAAESANHAERLAIEKITATSNAQADRDQSAREDKRTASEIHLADQQSAREDRKAAHEIDIAKQKAKTDDDLARNNAQITKHERYSNLAMRWFILLWAAFMTKQDWSACLQWLRSFDTEGNEYSKVLIPVAASLVTGFIVALFKGKNNKTKSPASQEGQHTIMAPPFKKWRNLLKQIFPFL